MEDNKYPWQRENPRLFHCILEGVTVLPEEEILQACTGDWWARSRESELFEENDKLRTPTL
jgi:hypothetical protein